MGYVCTTEESGGILERSNLQAGSETQPNSKSTGVTELITGSKAILGRNFILCREEEVLDLHHHYQTHFHGTVLN
jgi:hypothetical protein